MDSRSTSSLGQSLSLFTIDKQSSSHASSRVGIGGAGNNANKKHSVELLSYSHNEIMDYFTRQIVDSDRDYYNTGDDGEGSGGPGAGEREMTITDQFGFI
jgi:hypothetical protein